MNGVRTASETGRRLGGFCVGAVAGSEHGAGAGPVSRRAQRFGQAAAWVLPLLLAWMLPGLAAAQGKVEIEVGTQPGLGPLESQKWARLFEELKLDRQQIRGMRAGERLQITTSGSPESPTYHVVGVLGPDGTLKVQGKQFTLRDRERFSAWLAELREWGPQGAPVGRPLFGLNGDQFRALTRDLSQPVDFSTADQTHDKTFAALQAKFTHPVDIDPALAKQLADEDKVSVELRGLASGTAMSYILRPYGLAWRPERKPGGEIRLIVRPGKELEEIWPVGRPLTGQPVDVLPEIMENLTVEIEPTPLDQVLAALQARLKIPFLLDRNALVRHDIDPAKINVSYPGKKSWYQVVLQKVLYQAGLKFEVRLDDAGKPFLWISSQKK